MNHVKATKIFRTILIVEGTGEFPIDMLRYDACCPDTENDSHAVKRDTRRQVRLRRYSINGLPATAARWKSLGWSVVSEESVP